MGPFLQAARGSRPDRTPIWIMRQAGRYLPEYRKIREDVDFLTLTKTPDLAAEVTLQPIRRFGMDAAILFSDIMTPVEGMGLDLDFDPGPRIADPVRTRKAAEALRVPEPEESVPFVLETIRRIVPALPDGVPLIGFAGAPWTLSCYAVQGGGSKTFLEPRALLHRDPTTADVLLERLARTMEAYLRAQAQAGAEALMVFDSWVGLLSAPLFRRFVRPGLEALFESLADLDVPLIYFPNQGAHLHAELEGLPFHVLGVDWRVPLDSVRERTGGVWTLQGNLDPSALFSRGQALDDAVDAVLEAGAGGPHIFNLGHGIERSTDPETVARVVERVHAWRRR